MKTMRTKKELGWMVGVMGTYAFSMFTGWGSFKTFEAAVAYYYSQPRSGSIAHIVVIRTVDVGYGHKEEVRTLLGTLIRKSEGI